jgi:tetratricopeptide (TPR) repeat protein
MHCRTFCIFGLILVGALDLSASGQTRQQIDQCLNKSRAYSAEQAANACISADIAYQNRAIEYEDAKDYARAAAEHETRAQLPDTNEVSVAGRWRDACLDRIAAGQIDQASKDCEAGLAASPTYPPAHDAGGILYLRTGAWDKALAHFDAALSVFPSVAFSIYGRGLAKLKMGDIAGGNADMARATSLQPDIANKFALYGLKADAKVVAAPAACNASPGAAAKNLAIISQCEAVYCGQDAELQARRNLKHIDDMLTEVRLRISQVTTSLQKFKRACRAIGGRFDTQGPAMEIFSVASYELSVNKGRLTDLYESMQKPPEDNVFAATSAAMARTYKQPACMSQINQQTAAALDEARDLLDKSDISCP